MIKPVAFKVPRESGSALRIQIDEAPHFYKRMHFHPEIQITYIMKGRGLLYGGNSVCRFEEGDILMLGSNVPHILQCDDIYYTKDSPGIYSVSIFFNESGLGIGFFDIKEMVHYRQLIDASQRILKWTYNQNENIKEAFHKIQHQDAHHRIISFLAILSHLDATAYEYVNPSTYRLSTSDKIYDRIDRIFEYTMSHLDSQITVESVAKEIHLSPSQFSRYFKQHTGKTYVQFVNDLRVEKACQYLLASDDNIEHIAFKVGFNNISHFNRVFKASKSQSPKDYRKSFDFL